MLGRRHSVRRFTGEAVCKEDIARMIKAAVDAPSSKNSRSSSLMVVEDPGFITRIAGMRDFGSAFVKNAPLAILVMGDEARSDLWKVNAAISATYLQLSAEALGLGSCWVHVEGRPHRKDDPDGLSAEEYLQEFLPVPEGRRILCVVAVGHSAEPVRERIDEVCDGKDRVITL